MKIGYCETCSETIWDWQESFFCEECEMHYHMICNELDPDGELCDGCYEERYD